ncbi:MAG: hypothetical protein ACTHM1_10305 [Solirubrobacteraceae bacterium]
MANSQENDIAEQQHPDLLAAVVLHVLVSEGRQGVSLEQVAQACERDPNDAAERREVQVALEILVRDELASSEADGAGRERFKPTRAAVRAAELSF